MKKEKQEYGELYDEMEKYEKNGVCILMEGRSVSPIQVVKAHMAREHVSYMRDYEMDAEGRLETVSFIDINKNRRRRRYFRPNDSLYAEKSKRR